MDGTLTKPLAMETLQATIEAWIPSSTAGDAANTTRPAPLPINDGVAEIAVLDTQTLKEMFGDDNDMLKEILGDFVGTARDIIAEIDAGYRDRDVVAIRLASHKLKSSARTVGALVLTRLCEELERLAKSNDWPAIETTYPQLEKQMADVSTHINAL